MFKDVFYKGALKALVLLVLYVVAARFTYGVVPLLLVVVGGIYLANRKPAITIGCFMFLVLSLKINPILLPKEGLTWTIALRVGPMLLALGLFFFGIKRRVRYRLPLAAMAPFLLSTCIGSAFGWWPLVSYMKLINYSVFLFGICYGVQGIQDNPRDVLIVRETLFAIVSFIIVGSLLLIPFPAISYMTSLRGAYAMGGVDAALDVYEDIVYSGGMTLLCGIVDHSQALSPILGVCLAWLLCDMLFVENRVRIPHLALIVMALPMIYMTRSRLAFVTLVAALVMIYFYTIRKVQVPHILKKRFAVGMTVFISAIVLAMVVLEVKDNTVSKWLRKTQDVGADVYQRSLSEAMTASRQGLIEYSMYEFRTNPIFGTGFQVSKMNREVAGKDAIIVFSAPIEKGILPIMVLGETGVVGTVLFVLFLVLFYLSAMRQRLFVTVTMFSLLIVTNMGEGSFFSPGGHGGVLYVICVFGGFVTDMIVLHSPRLSMSNERTVKYR